MHRRTLLAMGGVGALGGVGGCLGRLDGVGPGDEADDGGDVPADFDPDCDRFDGQFGELSIEYPADVPDEATVVDLEETGLLEYDGIETELDGATGRRDAAEELREDGGDRSPRIGWIQLGEGTPYDPVEASLADTDGVERNGIRYWYVEYLDDTYRLSLIPTRYPVGDRLDRENISALSTPLEVSLATDVPNDATVIDAHEEGFTDLEYLGEALAIAGCHDELEAVSLGQRDRLVDYFVPGDSTSEVRSKLGSGRKASDGWYVGYGGETYRLELHPSAR